MYLKKEEVRVRYYIIFFGNPPVSFQIHVKVVCETTVHHCLVSDPTVFQSYLQLSSFHLCKPL